jgi:sarcosine oxidase subunit gamma
MAESVAIAEAPYRGRLLLRLSPEARPLAEATLGMTIPTTPLTATEGENASCLWLGPDEWLLAMAPERVETQAADLRAALAGTHHAIVDVSHRSIVLQVSGSRARDVLAAGCPLDLHAAVFGVGAVARSTMGKVGVILHRTGQDSYEVHVERSFADYLRRFLAEAAREFGPGDGAGPRA